jgi:hypothetical protein
MVLYPLIEPMFYHHSADVTAAAPAGKEKPSFSRRPCGTAGAGIRPFRLLAFVIQSLVATSQTRHYRATLGGGVLSALHAPRLLALHAPLSTLSASHLCATFSFTPALAQPAGLSRASPGSFHFRSKVVGGEASATLPSDNGGRLLPLASPLRPALDLENEKALPGKLGQASFFDRTAILAILKWTLGELASDYFGLPPVPAPRSTSITD